MIPFEIKADFEYKTGTISKTTIEIEYTKADLEMETLRFPFSIPGKYTSY